MRKFLACIYFAAMTAFIGACGGSSGANDPPPFRLPHGITLYGDSIIELRVGRLVQDAYAVQYGSSYADLTDHVVFERSISGDTAQNLLARLPLESRLTPWVLIQVGTNDISVGRNPAPDISAAIAFLREEYPAVQIVLTGIAQRASVDSDLWHQANADIAALAGDGVHFADVSGVPYSGPDGLHPDAVMAESLARKILEAVAKLP